MMTRRVVRLGASCSACEASTGATLAQALSGCAVLETTYNVQGNSIVYFDIQLGRYGDAEDLGRVVIELKDNVVPKTTENFRQLCLAAPGAGFAASRFHRVIPNFMAQVSLASGLLALCVCVHACAHDRRMPRRCIM